MRTRIVVAVVLVVLAAFTIGTACVAWIAWRHVRGSSRDSTKTSMRALAESVKMFRLRYARLPTELRDVCPEEFDGDEPPKDGWGNDFLYVSRPDGQFEIVSFGADGQLGGDAEDADLTLADARAK